MRSATLNADPEDESAGFARSLPEHAMPEAISVNPSAARDGSTRRTTDNIVWNVAMMSCICGLSEQAYVSQVPCKAQD